MLRYCRFGFGTIVVALLSCDDGAQAESLPVRKAGHWRITTIAPTFGSTTIEACITEEDSIAAPADGRECAAPEVTRARDQVIVNVVCTTKLGQERTSTLYTGDFTSWYRGIMKMTFDPPISGLANMGVSIDAKYVGSDCATSNPK